MEWNKYPYGYMTGKGRGLQGIDIMDELNKPLSEQQKSGQQNAFFQQSTTGVTRRFGTELSKNVMNNRDNGNNNNLNLRKRTFKQVFVLFFFFFL